MSLPRDELGEAADTLGAKRARGGVGGGASRADASVASPVRKGLLVQSHSCIRSPFKALTEVYT